MADRVSIALDVTRFNRRIARYIAASGQDVEAATLQVATEVLADTVEAWPVDSGASRAAWWGPRRIAPAAFQIGNPVVYAKVLEYGGYRGVGPKTEARGGTQLAGVGAVAPGIFSTQAHAPLQAGVERELSTARAVVKSGTEEELGAVAHVVGWQSVGQSRKVPQQLPV